MPFINANEIQLYYEIQGQGQPLILISGVGQGALFWQHCVPWLAQYYQVICFDNRGIGQSSMPDDNYTVESFAQDTLALIKALALQRPHIIGHSLGAAVACELGRRYAEEIQKIIMISALYPGPQVIKPSERALNVLTHREGEPLELMQRGIRIATHPTFEQQHPARFNALVHMNLTRNQPAEFYLKQVYAGLQYLAEDKLELMPIQSPLCLICGEQDEVTPPENSLLIQKNTPQAQLHVLKETGHNPPWECPEQLLPLIRHFLA